jgi:hypothetical protein
MDDSGVQIDEDQHVEATKQHGVDVEEVAGHHGRGLGLQELLPGGTGSPWGGFDAVMLEDRPDRGRSTVMPIVASSPWMRRYPHVGFSVPSRQMRATVPTGSDGRPGFFEYVHRLFTRSRCQRSSVSG